jgi:hypothetical protein
MSDLIDALETVRRFKGVRLATQVAQLEYEAEHKTASDLRPILERNLIDNNLLTAAVALKRAAAQIDEVVHAVGILLCLPVILEATEMIESLSLAAGNTGRTFDLETDKRIAEFTFIEWKGGAESIRKQKLFKDFYTLSEVVTQKKRYIYVVGHEHGPRVFLSRSPCAGMLRKYADLQKQFVQKYGSDLAVREYYQQKQHLIEIVDLASAVPSMAGLLQ